MTTTATDRISTTTALGLANLVHQRTGIPARSLVEPMKIVADAVARREDALARLLADTISNLDDAEGRLAAAQAAIGTPTHTTPPAEEETTPCYTCQGTGWADETPDGTSSTCRVCRGHGDLLVTGRPTVTCRVCAAKATATVARARYLNPTGTPALMPGTSTNTLPPGWAWSKRTTRAHGADLTYIDLHALCPDHASFGSHQ